jgi:hypothetical protein
VLEVAVPAAVERPLAGGGRGERALHQHGRRGGRRRPVARRPGAPRFPGSRSCQPARRPRRQVTGTLSCVTVLWRLRCSASDSSRSERI